MSDDEFDPMSNGGGPAVPPPKTQKKLTVEKIYQKKSQLEHILLRPDTYIGIYLCIFLKHSWETILLICYCCYPSKFHIYATCVVTICLMSVGSVERVKEQMWVYDKEKEMMVQKELTYVPGLYKIYDEILVNAADNKQRDPKMDCIKIVVDK